VLGGLAELHRAAKNESDLDAAKKIAKAAIAEFSDDNDIIHESCEPDSCDSNATQFKGIFIRNLKLLHSVAPDDAYMRVINASAKSIWKNDRNGQNQLGLDWAGPVTQVDASTHSSAMDALVAAIKN
jgi:predicted alpha-1,6-mannanase (GH76 family)